ncbi:MAG: hypothetical protein FGM52_15335 [Mycobacterium sp.]|nr:hypothetical protein [Mycobacterium sp.]
MNAAGIAGAAGPRPGPAAAVDALPARRGGTTARPGAVPRAGKTTDLEPTADPVTAAALAPDWAPPTAARDVPSAAVAGPAASDIEARPAAVVPPQRMQPPQAVTVPPRALGSLAAPTGARASAFADVLGDLLGQIQAFFEGAALLVRRTFFNEAPTVSPVQLTGQTEGPITGSIGAVDPEDDPLKYTITRAPRHGTVTVTNAGEYQYLPGPEFDGADSFAVTAADTGFHINLRDLLRPAGTAADVTVARGAVAPVLRFQFVYGSGSQYWSPAARTALESAAARLGAYFVVPAPVTVTYRVTGRYSPLSGTLAEAGSDFAGSGTGFLQTVVQSKIQTGVDPNGSATDGDISWNFGPPWSFDDPIPVTRYDFQSIAMHELLHTLGFLSNVGAPGTNTGQTWTVYDSFLMDSAGSQLIGPGGKWNTAYDPTLTGSGGGVLFGGPNAVAANGGRVAVHTPNPWAPGSSMSHLSDYVSTGSAKALMTAVFTPGPALRVLGAVELGILRDIGYAIAPGSGLAMMVVFFAPRPRRRTRSEQGRESARNQR